MAGAHKYATVMQLAQAYASGELSRRDCHLVLDNDDAFVYEGEEKVFGMHPADVTDQALTMLGIPWDPP